MHVIHSSEIKCQHLLDITRAICSLAEQHWAAIDLMDCLGVLPHGKLISQT